MRLKLLIFVIFSLQTVFAKVNLTDDQIADQFLAKYFKFFPTVDALKQARANAVKKYYEIDDHNALFKAGKVSFEKGSYEHDWMTKEEFIKFKTGLKNEGSRRKRAVPSVYLNTATTCTNLSPSKNWTALQKVAPIQNQNTCGCCYVFGAIAAIESAVAIKYNTAVTKLSEQQILDCIPNGCGGGWPTMVSPLTQPNGAVGAVNYGAYNGAVGTCNSNVVRDPKTVVTDWLSPTTAGSESELMCLVDKYGPVAVAIFVNPIQNYKSGIYMDLSTDPTTNCLNQAVNHEVVVVGYGNELNSQGVPTDYWLIRNSWGTAWGLNGYFKLARNKNNLCQIASYPLFPVLKDVPTVAPTTTTAPTQAPTTTITTTKAPTQAPTTTPVPTQAPTTTVTTTKAPTQAPTTTPAPTQAPTTTIITTTKAPTLDTSICRSTKNLFDSTNKYLKTACFVSTSVNFAAAQASCASRGMKLFVVDTAASPSLQALIPFTDSFVGVYYNNPYRVWINYGQCTDFANNAGAYTINYMACTEVMFYVCEYSSPPPTTLATTTQAPTTPSTTTIKIPSTVDTSICRNTQRFYDASNTYLKTACMVPTLLTFAAAQSSCTSRGMKLFVIDTTTSPSTQKFIPYADSFIGTLYNLPYRVWINYGQCTDFANNAGAYTINYVACTDSKFYVCEFF